MARKLRLIFSTLCFLVVGSSFAQIFIEPPFTNCVEQEIVVFYVNGVLVDRENSLSHASALSELLINNTDLLEIDSACLRIKRAYSESLSLFNDFFESFRLAQFQNEWDKFVGSVIYSLRFVGSLQSPADEYIINKYLDFITNTKEIDLQISTITQAHNILYKKELDAGRKVVLIAHSQGNFFANRSYQDLVINGDIPQDMLRIISIASPASYSEYEGNPDPLWLTNESDAIQSVLNSLPPYFPTPLCSTSINVPTVTTLKSIKCHGFLTAYLKEDESRQRILDLFKKAIKGHPVDISRQLIAHYKFEDNVRDSGPEGYQGTERGGFFYTQGVNGKSVFFDGVNDNIIIGSSVFPHFNSRKPFSFSVWVSPINTDQADLTIFSRDDKENDREMSLSINGNRAVLRRETDPSELISSSMVLRDGFYHVVATYDGNTSKIYIDGQFEKSIQHLSAEASSVPPLIGARFLDGSLIDFFKGRIDELRIYSRAISEAEVRVIYELDKPAVKFFDGFESNAVGDIPDNWELKNWSDFGLIRIVDAPISSGIKSIKVGGGSPQGICAANTYEELPHAIDISFDVNVPIGNSSSESIGSFMYAGISITFYLITDNEIEVRINHDASKRISGISTGQWHRFNLQVNWVQSNFTLSLNNTFIGPFTFIKNPNGGWGSDMCLYGNSSSQNNTAFYDNFKINPAPFQN